ncbi:MAG: heme ABC transporter ATP-binding protein [Planctomycetes bacterium]|nr:heme ABC transporter ATP-binding protein [Planctomycetota bacterium]
MAEHLLEVQDCSFSYGSGEFGLEDVSLHVARGEVVGLVGPNGSGKSTLLRLMGGFLRPSSGELLLEGRAVRQMQRRELARRLAFLPQSPASAFSFTSRQVVAMGRFPYQGAFGFMRPEDARAVKLAMEETHTAYLAERSLATLSGGEKQRVLIAAILAQEPALMLLDEPTAALDIHHRVEVLALLRALAGKGIAVALVTHDLNAAARFCDRLVLLSGGRAVRSGTAAEVMEAELLAQVYDAPVRVAQHPISGDPMIFVAVEESHAEG